MGHFCVNCGAPLEPRVLEGRELEACPHDDFVLWRDPKVAAAMIVEAPEGIVLGRRAIEPGYGLWCLPGGFVNDDEHPAAAVVRECLEEINAGVEVTQLLGVYHGAKRTGSSIVVIVYRGRVLEGETLAPGAEMLEVGVFRPDALPPVAFPSHREALAQYATATPRAAAPPSQPRARSQPLRRR